jgi:hypothetical protein
LIHFTGHAAEYFSMPLAVAALMFEKGNASETLKQLEFNFAKPAETHSWLILIQNGSIENCWMPNKEKMSDLITHCTIQIKKADSMICFFSIAVSQ